jgi:hypothetical protein
MSDPSPLNLHFEESGRWYILPDWAEYFIGVGKHLAAAPKNDGRIVTALIVPTRAFAAVFVTLGIVIADAAARDKSSEASHFESLFFLPNGAKVVFREANGRAYKGILLPPLDRDGKLWIRVQVHSKSGGGLTYFVDEAHSLQVQPAAHSGKLPKKQSGNSIRLSNKFVEKLVGNTDPVQLGLQSRMVCAIVGKRSTLEQEIRHTDLAIHFDGSLVATGCLQDVLRVDRFVSPHQSRRSVLISTSGDGPSPDVVSGIERCVVFDGAAGFLKWGNLWGECHQVVIVDRTEPFLDDAVIAINRRLSQNSSHESGSLTDDLLPPSVEILTFREATL